MIYWIGYYSFYLLSWLFFPLTVFGRKHLPSNQPFILASNHISNLDPFIVGVASRQKLCYLAKEELFSKKIVGFLLRALEAFPIKRDGSDFRAMREVFRRLKGGQKVVMFPEGTRKGSGRESKINQGIGFIAAKSALPVIPVFIQGSDKVFPPGSKWFNGRQPVTVTFGSPLQFSKDQSYPQIAEEVMVSILNLAE